MYSKCVCPAEITLEVVLTFFTAATEIPTNGYPNHVTPTLKFDHAMPFPTASTCAIELTLPTMYADKVSSYPPFKEAMDTALLCHGGFGLV